ELGQLVVAQRALMQLVPQLGDGLPPGDARDERVEDRPWLFDTLIEHGVQLFDLQRERGGRAARLRRRHRHRISNGWLGLSFSLSATPGGLADTNSVRRSRGRLFGSINSRGPKRVCMDRSLIESRA